MLLALEDAIVALLKSAFPALFTGEGAATVTFPADTWDFDPLSADPVAGEPGPEDAVDDLAFDPSHPAGPYTLTRPPYPGPKRVYLRSAAGELVALSSAELTWDPANPASFTFAPRPGRDVTGFDQLEIQYGVVAVATRLKTLHKLTLQITAADAATAEQALALSLSALALNRTTLIGEGGFSWNAGSYQAEGTLKTLKFSAGAATAAASRQLNLEAEVDLRLERMLAEDEGKPIEHILSPGKTAGTKPVDIDPAVQA
ncbi:MAG TPA: hypothetical protein VMH32_13280 [Burkholderiales bacterium]|nr:hypothetical protein [Burkholderiales bacterium]